MMIASGPEPQHMDERPTYLRAALFPYACLPHRSLWRSMLDRLHALGFNAVFVPFPWRYHSPASGFHDVMGPRDVSALLDEIVRAGLWLIPHIGPWLPGVLPGGGIPPWCTAYHALRDGPARPHLLRSTRDAVAAWWDVLLPHLCSQPNLTLCALDPGLPAEAPEGVPLTLELLTLAHERGLPAPYLLPHALHTALVDCPGAPPTLPYRLHRAGEALPSQPEAAMIWITWPEGPFQASGAHATALTEGLTSVLARFPVVVISGLHALSPWGCLYADAPVPTRDNLLAPPLELTAHSDLCAAVKQALFQAETLRGLAQWEDPGLQEELRPAGEADGAPARFGTPWTLQYGRVLQSTLRPLLHLTVARRELLVVENPGHGALVIEGILSPRRTRGDVQVVAVEPTGSQRVAFGAGALETVIFSTPEGYLQIVALSPALAARLWPLDDLWRSAPCSPSHWTASSDQPARGLIVGSGTALPGEAVAIADGAMTYTAVVQGRGYGYRWGPWRGSDPLTWLAPFYWDAPTPFTLPALTWEQRAGAPEALPEYDDEMWQTVSLPLALDLGSELARSCGLFWLRASFDGRPGSLTLTIPADGDLFLNGVLIASLTASPRDEASEGGSRTIPLPARYLRERNVLAILADVGWLMPWDLSLTERSNHGHGHTLSCQFEGARNVTWKRRWGILGQVVRQGFADFADWRLVDGEGSEAITWHRSLVHLDLPREIEAPIFLTLESPPRQAWVYLNGVLLRRLDQRQAATERIWLPDGLLKRTGRNEILIAQWTRGARPEIRNARLEAGPTAHVISRKLVGR